MHSEESPLKLIVIGGDGTMNEVINTIDVLVYALKKYIEEDK